MRKNHQLEKQLIEIVNEEFNIDIRTISRKREIADGRAVFYKILFDNEYSLTLISEIINKHHATVINGLKVFDTVLRRNKYYKAGYNKCKEKFEELCDSFLPEEEPVMTKEEMLIEEVNMLKKKVSSLKYQIKYLNSLNRISNEV
jgi:hypothetical protein